jgi:5-methylcytosine-specific restriction endonuclease McrA
VKYPKKAILNPYPKIPIVSEHSSSGRAWRDIRLRILERDSYICGYCGAEATQVDHIIARANGGTDDPSNLVAACQPCNNRKSDKHLQRVPFVRKEWIDLIP